jgi:hypothetical protein
MSNRYEQPWTWREWLELAASLVGIVAIGAILAVLILFAAACGPMRPTPPPPSPPPATQQTWNFAMVFPCQATVGAEGWSGGPHVSNPDGYIYVSGIPANPDPATGQPRITHGHVQAQCDGWQTWDEDKSWGELVAAGPAYYVEDMRRLGPPPLPPAPSKSELQTAPHTFQGLRANCPEFDTRPLPIFDVMIDAVGEACKQSILDAHENAGDRLVAMALSHAYLEPGIEAPISTGHDWTYDLPGLNRFLGDVIRRPRRDGRPWLVQLHLAGDGLSAAKGADGRWRYNDPVGWTYGYEFIRDFFPTLNACLHGQMAGCDDDVHAFVRLVNGFDGVFYGWDPAQGVAFARQVKDACPDCVLGIEFNSGHIPFGEGDSDYRPGGRMRSTTCCSASSRGRSSATRCGRSSAASCFRTAGRRSSRATTIGTRRSTSVSGKARSTAGSGAFTTTCGSARRRRTSVASDSSSARWAARWWGDVMNPMEWLVLSANVPDGRHGR